MSDPLDDVEATASALATSGGYMDRDIGVALEFLLLAVRGLQGASRRQQLAIERIDRTLASLLAANRNMARDVDRLLANAGMAPTTEAAEVAAEGDDDER